KLHAEAHDVRQHSINTGDSGWRDADRRDVERRGGTGDSMLTRRRKGIDQKSKASARDAKPCEQWSVPFLHDFMVKGDRVLCLAFMVRGKYFHQAARVRNYSYCLSSAFSDQNIPSVCLDDIVLATFVD